MIETLAFLFGAQAGFIGWSGPETVGFQVQFGNDPVWLERYVTTYRQHDILLPLLMAQPEGVCAAVRPHLERADVRAGIFYREYLAPQGIVDNLAVTLLKRPGLTAHLALLRREPAVPFSDADRAGLQALVPHLRRAVYIQSHLVRAADQAAAVRALVGSGGGALLILDAARRVIDIDPQVAGLLRLAVGEPVGDGPAARAIVQTVTLGSAVAVEVTDGDGDPVALLLEARRLEPGRFGDLSSGTGAAYVVHVTRVDRPRPIALTAMGNLYRLTPTELRVLGDAIAQADLTGIGERLGMAPATARTHLHRIYDKTGTRSFAGLSGLAYRFALVVPVRDDSSVPGKQMMDAPPPLSG